VEEEAVAAMGAMAAGAGSCSRRHRVWSTVAAAAGTPARVMAAAGARTRARAGAAAVSSPELAVAL